MCLGSENSSFSLGRQEMRQGNLNTSLGGEDWMTVVRQGSVAPYLDSSCAGLLFLHIFFATPTRPNCCGLFSILFGSSGIEMF